MSDKAFKRLWEADKVIRETISATVNSPKDKPWSVLGEDGTLLTIRFISGFEKFNTRPYHNYETWGQGYRVEGRGVVVEREDLDDAIREWQARTLAAYCEGEG